jgi:hypothetical protein
MLKENKEKLTKKKSWGGRNISNGWIPVTNNFYFSVYDLTLKEELNGGSFHLKWCQKRYIET